MNSPPLPGSQPSPIVDVIAPSGPFDVEAFLQGIDLLKRGGFLPRYRLDIVEREGFLAGSDARRLSELKQALLTQDSQIIWCVRGGYGATRLLDSLPLELIQKANKLLIGFSDITALHARWHSAGLQSIHASMVARLASEPSEVLERLFRLLRDEPVDALKGECLVSGTSQGVLSGGNLALLSALCGTPYQPDFRGCVVFLEDVGERPYRLDRMWVQCRQAGLMDGVVGLALGEFSDCDGPQESTAAQILAEHARSLGVPTLTALPCGHGRVNMALPFGRQVLLDADRGLLHVEVA